MDNRKSEVLIVPKKPIITVEGRGTPCNERILG